LFAQGIGIACAGFCKIDDFDTSSASERSLHSLVPQEAVGHHEAPRRRCEHQLSVFIPAAMTRAKNALGFEGRARWALVRPVAQVPSLDPGFVRLPELGEVGFPIGFRIALGFQVPVANDGAVRAVAALVAERLWSRAEQPTQGTGVQPKTLATKWTNRGGHFLPVVSSRNMRMMPR
jgi:hypothetical protein